MHLRCTLMGSERNYQVKILSKQRDVAKFTTMSMPSNDISPGFFSGFADAEGSFSILIQNPHIKYVCPPLPGGEGENPLTPS